MNNRLNLQDMVNLLAAQTGKSKKETERFLRTFISVVSEGVFKDRIVKVKGLGTFKIIPVEKRESIDVNTGKRFIIPEHYKFNFSPDKDLKELVNKPFSFFETTEVSDGAEFLDTDSKGEAISSETSGPENTIQAELPPVTGEPIESFPDEEEQEIAEEEKAAEPSVSSQEKISETPLIPKEDIQNVHKSSSKKGVVGLLIILAVILVVIGVVFFMNRKPSSGEKNEKQILLPATTSQPIDSTVSEQNSQTILPSDTISPATSEPEILATVSIEPGSRLTLIALEYYKHKVFWVYLYEYNKSKISDPNNVPIGTEIVIPHPKKFDIDASDRASLDRAIALQNQILSTDK